MAEQDVGRRERTGQELVVSLGERPALRRGQEGREHGHVRAGDRLVIPARRRVGRAVGVVQTADPRAQPVERLLGAVVVHVPEADREMSAVRPLVLGNRRGREARAEVVELVRVWSAHAGRTVPWRMVVPEEPAIPAPRRVVALGASNLTRGLPALVGAAREAWGPDVEVLAALGLGRSYGAPSRILVRTLPGILESGLWRTLEGSPGLATRALITDVGNDILYGSSAPAILAWVEECVDRLQRFTPDIVVTDLPLSSIRRLSSGRFLFFRSMLFPRCHLTHAEVMAIAEAVVDGLASLAARRGLQFFKSPSRVVRLRPDPLPPEHVARRLARDPAWPSTGRLRVAAFAWGGAPSLRPLSRAAVAAGPRAGQWAAGAPAEARRLGAVVLTLSRAMP